ncbi:MAG TPA: hypothetical protein VJQ42_11330 [Rhodanobacteraceae bacterium]|nr:hypothetical protein [Rhodanobacteraceae bacterium]
MNLHRAIRILPFATCLCATGFACLPVAANAAVATIPHDEAMPWAPGDTAPAFVPDGSTVIFARGKGTSRRLYVSHHHDGRWSKPDEAPFSGRWMDIEPAMSPDGSYLVFISNRPAKSGGKALDGYFGGKLHTGRGGNLWRVAFRDGKWGMPVRLPDAVNASTSMYSPAVAADGSLYFTRPDPHTGHTRLYASRRVGGRYQPSRPVTFSDGVASDYDPAVAPDQSFIVFSSDRAPTPPNHSGLFIAFAAHGAWSTPIAMGVYGYEARLSADLATLYFNADGDQRIHAMPIGVWLQRNRPVAER